MHRLTSVTPAVEASSAWCHCRQRVEVRGQDRRGTRKDMMLSRSNDAAGVVTCPASAAGARIDLSWRGGSGPPSLRRTEGRRNDEKKQSGQADSN